MTGKHRKTIPAWEACGMPEGTTGYYVLGPITKRIGQQSSEVQELRMGGDRDSSNNDRHTNP